MFHHYKLDPDDDLDIESINLLKKAPRLLRAKKQIMAMVYTDKKNDRIEDLVDKCEKKLGIGSLSNNLTQLSRSAFQSFILSSASIFYSNGARVWPAYQKIDKWTKMMQSLFLLVRTLHTHVRQASLNKTPLIIFSPAKNNIQRSRSGSNFQERVDKCNYYWGTDHHLKCDCGAFPKDLNFNLIHLRDDRKVSLVAYIHLLLG